MKQRKNVKPEASAKPEAEVQAAWAEEKGKLVSKARQPRMILERRAPPSAQVATAMTTWQVILNVI